MPTCVRCKLAIGGRHPVARALHWHPSCFQCAVCLAPVGDERVTIDGELLAHPECAGGEPACTVCAGPLHGGFYQTFWGERYCQGHASLPRCYSCQRPVARRLTGGGQRHIDGRVRCCRCGLTAVEDDARAQRLLVEVRSQVEQQGFPLGHFATPVRLVDQPALARLAGTNLIRPSALTRIRFQSMAGGASRGSVEEIAVLGGLPAEHFQAVAAHELGHAWLCAAGVMGLERVLEEGVAELAADRWLRTRGTKEADFRLHLMHQNQDPVYGAGYRTVHRAVERSDVGRVLESIRLSHALPSA